MNEQPVYEELELQSSRGAVRCVYQFKPREGAGQALSAVIMVGGGDGGLVGPADSLYVDLSTDLSNYGIGSLRLDFRIHAFPGNVEEAAYDVRVGLKFLLRQGVRNVGLLGHSFGGAVVIDVGAEEETVTSVVTLATQTAGAQRVPHLAPVPLLLIHGLDDVRLSPDCSRMLYQLAGEPKRIELLEGARHSLRQRREDVRSLVVDWFTETVQERPGS